MITCPLNLKSISHCSDDMCKYYSVIDPNCIMLSRDDALNDKISDNEIAYFKGIHVKEVASKKKEAEDRVKRLLLLEQYINLIDSNTEEPPLELEILLLNWMERFPMNSGLWPNTQLIIGALVNEQYFEYFKSRFKFDFTMEDILWMSESEIRMCREFLN
jgi:hypothetical protein